MNPVPIPSPFASLMRQTGLQRSSPLRYHVSVLNIVVPKVFSFCGRALSWSMTVVMLACQQRDRIDPVPVALRCLGVCVVIRLERTDQIVVVQFALTAAVDEHLLVCASDQSAQLAFLGRAARSDGKDALKERKRRG